MTGVPNNMDMDFPMSKSWIVSSDMFSIPLRKAYSSARLLANNSGEWGRYFTNGTAPLRNISTCYYPENLLSIRQYAYYPQ